jgi:DNA-binding protein Fis
VKGEGGILQVGAVSTATTSNTGLPIEYWVDRCLNRIVQVSDTSESPIADQARAYREQIRQTLDHYMRNMIKSDRTTLYNLFIQQGHQDMAEILRKL